MFFINFVSRKSKLRKKKKKLIFNFFPFLFFFSLIAFCFILRKYLHQCSLLMEQHKNDRVLSAPCQGNTDLVKHQGKRGRGGILNAGLGS